MTRPPFRPFAETPINQLLGLVLVSHESGESCVRMEADERFTQEAGVIHGGVITSLADTAAAYAIGSTLEDDEEIIGVEFKMNFLRPANPTGESLTARAKTIKKGRTIAICSTEVYQGSIQVATAIFTMLVIPARSNE